MAEISMEKRIAQAGDVSLSYSVEGNGPETILLIMGLGSRAADWGTEFPSALAKRYRVVRFDNRGVGASPKVPGGYDLSDMARDATKVLDAVDARDAHVVGVSMGGMISQLIAAQHPDRVKRLVLLSTHFGGPEAVPPHPDAMRLFDPSAFLERGNDPVAMMKFTIDVISAAGFMERAPEVVTALLENVRREPTHPSAFISQVQAILGSDRSELIRSIGKPTLVVHGTEDKLIPSPNGEMIAARIPGAKLVLFEKCGHMLMWETPQELARVVLDFLA
jgi:pimeloyl-ACP methyl ester carboxylesterase